MANVGTGGNFLLVPIEKINNIKYNGDTIKNTNEDMVGRFVELSSSGKGVL